MTATVTGSDGGFDLELSVATDGLLPGRSLDGRLRLVARDGGSIRGARVTLVGTETWRYDVTTTDSKGRTQTTTHTGDEELPKVPVAVLGPTDFAPGEVREFDLQVPVPPLGPPTVEATEFRIDWEIRVTLDVPGFDPTVVLPVRLLQPTSLLRAGVVEVGQFALFDAADARADDLAGSIWLEPVPMCIGAPFRGELMLTSGEARDVQEVRLELRAFVESTVSGGRSESISLWSGRLAGEGRFGGEVATYPFEGVVSATSLPTTATAHGRVRSQFHVVVAVAWAPDPHLVRDVAICSTTEL